MWSTNLWSLKSLRDFQKNIQSAFIFQFQFHTEYKEKTLSKEKQHKRKEKENLYFTSGDNLFHLKDPKSVD